MLLPSLVGVAGRRPCRGLAAISHRIEWPPGRATQARHVCDGSIRGPGRLTIALMAGPKEGRVLVVHRDALLAEALTRALFAERGGRANGAAPEHPDANAAAAAPPPGVAAVDPR